MQVIRKIWQRLGDPVFYRKNFRDLVRTWKGFDDEPKARSIDALGKVEKAVFVVAHPDDETFCSGLICQLVDHGLEVNLLCLTRGEGGPTGEATREELGRVREAEMRRSCEVLGIGRVEFLDHVDPIAKGFRVFAPDVSPRDLASQILPLLEGADVVVSHGSSGEYWHPAHLLVYRAVDRALRHCHDVRWLTFLARDPEHPLPKLLNWDDPAFLSLDVSNYEEKRWQALSSHESQLGLFGRFAGGDARAFVDRTSVENFCLKQGATNL